MPGSELKGTGRAATYPNSNKGYKKGGRIKAAKGYNTGRENLLEEEGRIKSEPQTKNVRAEEKRVVGEIKKGYKKGGRAGFSKGGKGSWGLATKGKGCEIR